MDIKLKKALILPAIIIFPAGVASPKDNIGNIRATVNESGSIVTKDDYYPFGLQMPGMSYNSGNSNDRLKYSGKELDEEIGLKYHFGWRDYNPELGRWFVVDPARQFASPYVAMANNPIGYYDEDGQFAWMLFFATVIWNSAFYGTQEMNHGGDFWSWDGAGKGAVIGAVSNAGGQFAAAFAPAGAVPGAAYGAVTGSVLGGITSEVAGGKFCDGFYSGAISGAIGGGYGGYKKASAMGVDVWTGEWNPTIPEAPPLIEVDIPKIEHSINTYNTGRCEIDFEGDIMTMSEIMSDGSFDVVDSWESISGPHGPRINEGTWIATGVTNDPNKLTSGMYRNDVGWKVYLEDQFGRTGMRIHPDAITPPSLPGTLGCIGIEENAQRLTNLYNHFVNYFNKSPFIRVIVKY